MTGLTISTGRSRKSTQWKQKTLTWEEFKARFREPVRTQETMAEYAALTRDEKAEIKDIGGFVGGIVENGARKWANVPERQIVCLDADYGGLYLWDEWELMIGCACVMHSSHSHTEENPRLRFLIPLTRPVPPEEYMPVARALAAMLDIEAFDDTTYETNRLMFWPSCPIDAPYVHREMDGPWVDPDDVLGSFYRGCDWHDMRNWPLSSRQRQAITKMGERQGDPLTKPGIIGAFNRVYRITAAIEKYLPGIYTPAGPGRWTYAGGTSTAGAVSYDEDTFLYSHHDHDPSHGRLCSAFDLVRLHLFGAADESAEPDTELRDLPSMAAMRELCGQDEAVRAELAESLRRDPEQSFERMDPLARIEGDLTEQGISTEFVDLYGANLRYSKSFGWMLWTGQVWELDQEAAAYMLVMQYGDDLYSRARVQLSTAKTKGDEDRAKALLKTAVKYRTNNGTKNLLSMVQKIVFEPAPETYDADAWTLNTPGGLVDLHTGTLRPHEKDAKCTKITSCSLPMGYAGGRAEWEAFVDHITAGDRDFAQYLQKLAGMAAVGEVYEEGLVISYGPGGNGKSTFFGALKTVLGDYAKTTRSEILIDRYGTNNLPFLAELRGVRLAVAGETEESARFGIAQMKQLTSRDNIKAKALYKDPLEFTPTHTLILHTNHLPKLSSIDQGTKRRIAVAPFPATLPPERVITNYERQLVERCGSDILQWIVDGARLFYEAGCKLEKPAVVLEATRIYLEEEDWLQQFIDDCCVTGSGRRDIIKGLYEAYVQYATKEDRNAWHRTKQELGRALEMKGYKKKRKNSAWYFEGIERKTAFKAAEEDTEL